MIGREIEADPILKDFARRAVARGFRPAPIASPEDVLGERATVALDFMAQSLRGTGTAFAFDRLTRGHDGGLPRPSLAGIGEEIYRAQPYLWLSDIRREAGTHDVPRHIFALESVPQSMWWTWDTDLSVAGATAVGVLWRRRQSAVEVIHVGRAEGDAGGGVILAVSHLPRGFRFPDDAPRDQEPNIRGLLALLSFLNSPFIPQTERRMSPKLRGTYQREGATTERVDETVRFIDLRSSESDRLGATESPDDGVSYRHRWIVRGHHRAQWYPSLSAHKVIWIAPYVKGPDQAPMLVTAYRVRR